MKKLKAKNISISVFALITSLFIVFVGYTYTNPQVDSSFEGAQYDSGYLPLAVWNVTTKHWFNATLAAYETIDGILTGTHKVYQVSNGQLIGTHTLSPFFSLNNPLASPRILEYAIYVVKDYPLAYSLQYECKHKTLAKITSVSPVQNYYSPEKSDTFIAQ